MTSSNKIIPTKLLSEICRIRLNLTGDPLVLSLPWISCLMKATEVRSDSARPKARKGTTLRTYGHNFPLCYQAYKGIDV